jgi:RNA polymerase sigma factor (sigma-70 family)
MPRPREATGRDARDLRPRPGQPAELEPLSASSAAVDFEALYFAHRNLLLYLACARFRVPPEDAEALLHDVFLAFLISDVPLRDPRAWFVAAMSNAARAYRRRSARSDAFSELPQSFMDSGSTDPDDLERELLVREILRRLRSRDREVLRLRFFEELTVPEIGERLRTTTRYAERLVAFALTRVRDAYRRLHSPHSRSGRDPRL